jgi:hypothetical protein
VSVSRRAVFSIFAVSALTPLLLGRRSDPGDRVSEKWHLQGRRYTVLERVVRRSYQEHGEGVLVIERLEVSRAPAFSGENTSACTVDKQIRVLPHGARYRSIAMRVHHNMVISARY